MVAQAQVAAPKCEINFKYTFQNNFCPANALCLVADHVDYTFTAIQNADYYFWTFGDGSSTIDSVGKVSHAYFKSGKYEVSVAAYFNSKSEKRCKAFFTDSISVKFQLDNTSKDLCVADLQTTTSGLKLNAWDAKKSTEGALYFWNLGDGSKFAVVNSETGINHTYKKAGKYLVRMTKLIMQSYRSSEACDGNLTVDSITIMSPCFLNEICRETYTKWVTVSNEVPTIPNCNLKASIIVNGNAISYNSTNKINWIKRDTSIKVYPTDINIPKPQNLVTYNYWTFGDGTDTAYSEPNSIVSAHTHSYKKTGKYLVILHSAQFNDIGAIVRCDATQALKYDSILHSIIPCYHRLICRSIDSVWVEIGKVTPESKCLAITSSGMEVTANMELPMYFLLSGVFTHRYYNFGDGSDTMGLSQATHTYKKDGTYLVKGIEVTYYAPELKRKQLYPDSISYQCKAIITDPSIRFVSPYCPTKEISRIICQEWITIQNNKLVTSVSTNPANEYGNLNIENADGKVDFMIYNSAGTLVKKIEQILNGTQQFETADMATGLYLYTISKDGKILKRDKFMVNR